MVAVFFGAVASGLTGFAFAAVAGAVIFHLWSPVDRVEVDVRLAQLARDRHLVALVKATERESHSWRNASIGSRRAARLAG